VASAESADGEALPLAGDDPRTPDKALPNEQA